MNNIPTTVCDYLYGRDVDSTGKFCAGGSVDACQVEILLLKICLDYPHLYRRIQEALLCARIRGGTCSLGLLVVARGEECCA